MLHSLYWALVLGAGLSSIWSCATSVHAWWELWSFAHMQIPPARDQSSLLTAEAVWVTTSIVPRHECFSLARGLLPLIAITYANWVKSRPLEILLNCHFQCAQYYEALCFPPSNYNKHCSQYSMNCKSSVAHFALFSVSIFATMLKITSLNNTLRTRNCNFLQMKAMKIHVWQFRIRTKQVVNTSDVLWKHLASTQ